MQRSRSTEFGMKVASANAHGLSSSGSDFDSVRRECLRRNILYEDPDFPANDRSLYFSRHPPYRFEWLRPGELCRRYGLKPELFVGGAGRFDLKQGSLGDCWVISALACMSENMELVYRVVLRGQSFMESWYAGMFHFQFWRYGRWEEVIIDDLLPTVKGNLVFVHSASPNEMWGALIEKAYAKLHGSYEALKAGHMSDALTDLTGGLTESYFLQGTPAVPRNIINIMFKALERQSLIGCGIQPADGSNYVLETRLPNGLVTSHAYSITDLREIRLISDRGEIPITLIRIRNPWGTRVEWNGAWSDRSQEWNSIPHYDREAMGLVFRDDGEFWMDFRDFLTHFHTLDICNLTPDSPIETPRRWTVHTYHNRWVRGISAGGRPHCRESHWANPQFKVALKDTDDDEDSLCSIMVELMQKDRRKMRHKGVTNATIGFVIYKCVPEYNIPLPRDYFDEYHMVERVDFFINTRQVVKRFALQPGQYVIIPSTYDPNNEGEFLLRIFCENPNLAEEVEDKLDVSDVPIPSDNTFRDREMTVRKAFYDISGEDMAVDPFEFKKVVNAALKNDSNHKDLGIDACKSMVALVDTDHSGKLSYPEFRYLWDCIKSWKKTFYTYDTNYTGSISSFELRAALASHGYKLNEQAIKSLVYKFADERYQMDLDNFIVSMAKTMKLANVFKSHQLNGRAAFTLDEWFEQALLI